ncbi:MAG: dicarboxylate/amino acid:cation symporter [Porticoccaceae bacterium]|nr:dicarboxylate/amino acid:cation symporter [Porticoccaceae bacterium]
MTLTKRILLGMLAGLVLGVIFNILLGIETLPEPLRMTIEDVLVMGLFDTVGQIFIASLKLLVVPLVFVSLVLGTASLGSNSRMGVMAGKTVALYMVTTCIAITLALVTASIIKPGVGMDLASASSFMGSEAPSLKQVIINMFPTNPVTAMAEGNMLQIIVFSLLMGLALAQVGDRGQRTFEWFESADAVVMRMVLILMNLAPYGIFALLTKLFTQLGYGAIADLGKYVFTLVFVLVLHLTLVYCGLIKFICGLNPIKFLQNVRPAMLFAFSTASSSATLPVTIRTVENRMGVDNSVASFVLPLGATINMDGTAIMQGVATAFIAQAYGIDLSFTDYLMVILTATLASVGTAGVPGVGLIMLSMVLTQVGLPVEGVALIIGVDRLLDMLRTSVNVAGDSMVATFIGKIEDLFDRDIFEETSDTQV